jgi:hypothetical protein
MIDTAHRFFQRKALVISLAAAADADTLLITGPE